MLLAFPAPRFSRADENLIIERKYTEPPKITN